MVAGTLDVVLGLGFLGLGAAVAGRGDNRDALPLGLVFVLVGVLLMIGGLGRLTARLEVRADRLRWRWSFGSHEVPLHELEDAALVEKGSPAWGASWAGFLGGGLLGVGFFGVFLWWLAELADSVVSSEPTLGGLDLVVMKRRGGPVEVKPISAWSTRSSHSQATKALEAVKVAIESCASTVAESPASQSWRLLHDEWESPEPGAQVPPTTIQPPGRVTGVRAREDAAGYRETITEEPWPNRPWFAVMPTRAPSTWRPVA